MTTLEPGASEVFTHGLTVRPRSTAFFASSAAATITDGFDVFVHDVIDAIATCPWSSSVSVPSAMVKATCWLGRPSRRRNGVAVARCVLGDLVVGLEVQGRRVAGGEGLLARLVEHVRRGRR